MRRKPRRSPRIASDATEAQPAARRRPAPMRSSARCALRAAREAAGLSLDEVAQQLKLAPRQVRALEEDDFGVLPGRTFVRGFVRNYARLLNLDADARRALPGGAGAGARSADAAFDVARDGRACRPRTRARRSFGALADSARAGRRRSSRRRLRVVPRQTPRADCRRRRARPRRRRRRRRTRRADAAAATRVAPDSGAPVTAAPPATSGSPRPPPARRIAASCAPRRGAAAAHVDAVAGASLRRHVVDRDPRRSRTNR